MAHCHTSVCSRAAVRRSLAYFGAGVVRFFQVQLNSPVSAFLLGIGVSVFLGTASVGWSRTARRRGDGNGVRLASRFLRRASVRGALGLVVDQEFEHRNQRRRHVVRRSRVDAACYRSGLKCVNVRARFEGALATRAEPVDSLCLRRMRKLWQALIAFGIVVGVPGALATLIPLISRQWLVALAATSIYANCLLAILLTRNMGRTSSMRSLGFRLRYDLYSTQWSYEIEPTDPSKWRGTCVKRRDITALDPVDAINETLTRRSDKGLAFSSEPELAPVVELVDKTRSGPGEIELRPPHAQTGPSFAFRVVFIPDLAVGETASVTTKMVLPGYQFAFAEDVVARSQSSDVEVTGRDWNSWRFNYPTVRLEYSVFLPDELRAHLIGVELGDKGRDAEAELKYLKDHGCVQIAPATVGDVSGWRLKLDRDHPPIRTPYRLVWRPPSRADAAR